MQALNVLGSLLLCYAHFEEPVLAEHITRMSEIEGLDAKVLEPSDEEGNHVNYCDYRTLGKQFRDMAPWYLYDDYLVLSLHEAGGKREFVTVRSKLLAERYLKEFDIFWNLSAPIKRKKKEK